MPTSRQAPLPPPLGFNFSGYNTVLWSSPPLFHPIAFGCPDPSVLPSEKFSDV